MEFISNENRQPDSYLLKNEINQQLKHLLMLQEQRVLVLNEFELKFKEYLLDAPDFNFTILKTICKSASHELNSISTRIIEIKKYFDEDCFNIIAILNLIERLQEHEKNKFQLVFYIIFYLI